MFVEIKIILSKFISHERHYFHHYFPPQDFQGLNFFFIELIILLSVYLKLKIKKEAEIFHDAVVSVNQECVD